MRRASTPFVGMAALATALWPRAALAHGGVVGPGDAWSAWEFDPLVVFLLLLSAWLYVRGVRRLWRLGAGSGVKRWEAASFAGGWLTLAVSLLSPLHPIGGALFSVHMVQHELLMLVAAPLMVIGRPLPVTLAALPRGTAGDLARWVKASSGGRLWRVISTPLAAWLIHAAVLWGWHIPWMFEAVLRNAAVHAVQHGTFFASAVLFWWAVIHGGRAAGYGAAVLYMLTTAMHSGVLGAMLTFTKALWFPSYGETAPLWGLSGLEDQQIGGLIMWVPAGTVYIIAAMALVAGWLRESGRRVEQWQSRAQSVEA